MLINIATLPFFNFTVLFVLPLTVASAGPGVLLQVTIESLSRYKARRALHVPTALTVYVGIVLLASI
jgi:hypothetical protein